MHAHSIHIAIGTDIHYAKVYNTHTHAICNAVVQYYNNSSSLYIVYSRESYVILP